MGRTVRLQGGPLDGAEYEDVDEIETALIHWGDVWEQGVLYQGTEDHPDVWTVAAFLAPLLHVEVPESLEGLTGDPEAI